HGHHDGTQAEDGALHGGVHDGVTSRAALIDVLQHDHAGLHGHAEQREKADTRGDAEVGVGDQQRQQTAYAGEHHVDQNEHGPFEGTEHGVKNDDDQQNAECNASFSTDA